MTAYRRPGKRPAPLTTALALALAFAAGPALLGAAQSANAQIPVSSRIATSVLKGPSGISAAWLVGKPPSIPGVGLTFLTAASADLVTAKFLAGEIDAAVLPVNLAAKLYNSGAKLRAAAIVGGGMVRFLTADRTIARVADLRGEEIAIAGQKATPDFLFRFLLQSEGLVPDRDYRPLYSLSYPEAAAALAAGRIRHAVLPEPFATQALMLAPGLAQPLDLDRLWTDRTGMRGYPMSLLVVSQSLSDRNPDALRRYLAAYRDSIQKTVAEPDATGALAESLDLGLKAAVAAKAIPRSKYLYESAAAGSDGIEAILRVFLAFDPASIGGRLPDAAFYVPEAVAAFR